MNRFKKAAAVFGVLIALCALANTQQRQTAIIEKIDRADDISRIEQQSLKSSSGRTINVYNHKTGKTQTMDMEDYIYHVVAGEMPAGYDAEALKAQAVAARTYLIRKLADGSGDKQGADICTNSAHCQAFLSDEQLKKNWGENYNEYSSKLRKAVLATSAQILTYDGKAIEAFYHASSGGQTEDAKNVYSKSQPYLKSVSSSGDKDEHTVSFTLEQFAKLLGDAAPSSGITADNADSVKVISRYESGRVENVKVGSATLSGKEFRKALSLRSAIFSLSFSGGRVYITTKGYGHGVGMSQMGADYLAKEGKTYEEILSHYYSNASLTKISV